MNGLMSAAEGPFPMYTDPPPDQQPQDLPGALAMVESIIFRDGGMDQVEMATFNAWVKKIITRATAMAAMAPSPEQMAGLGGSSAREEYNPFGGTQAGLGPVPGYEDDGGASAY